MKCRYLLSLLIVLLALPLEVRAWDDGLYRQIEQSIAAPRIADAEYVITRYGAAPDLSAAQNQRAIQRAIDECSQRGGGHVVVPAGVRYMTGAVTLKSGVNLVVEEGARLEFAFEPTLYPIVLTSWEGLECYNLQPCIYAYEARDIAITGKGTIDGGGTRETWWAWCGNPKFGWHEGLPSQRLGGRDRLLRNGEDGIPMTNEKGERQSERVFTAADGMRPQLVNFVRCHRVLVEDVTLLRSPFWVVHPLMSTDVTLRRVRIINDGPNGDGCDPESCDRVLIEDCYFSTGDDCIAIKSGRNRDGRLRAMPSQNIIVRRCEMRNGHGGVVIGSEISGGCRNVFAHDCVMDSPNLERVLRIKSNSCRGGIIENINVKDVKLGVCKECVLKINLDYEHHEVCCRGNYPTVRQVTMENVTSKESQYGVQIIGLEEDTYVHDIQVRNCRFNGVRDGNFISGKTRDVHFDNLFINGSLALQQPPYEHYSEWMTYSEMKRTPHSYLLDFSKRPKWIYVMGIELEAMLDTYLKYGGEDIRRYCQEYTDTMISAKGEIRGYKLEDYNLDQVRTGHFVARMYQLYPEKKNLLALQTLIRQLRKQPRTEQDKVFWHKTIYSYQVWLDGIFMGLPFYTLTASLNSPLGFAASSSDSESEEFSISNSQFSISNFQYSIYNDAVNQIIATYQRTFDSATGLNRHAWDETKEMFWADKETGQTQHCWGRAQGWFSMALIELLDVLPEDYARRSEVLDLLCRDLDAVIRWQDAKSGLWYQVMDAPGRQGNYLEATCSSMFAYVLLKAYNKGYVDERYREAGLKAYRGIVRQFLRVEVDQTLSLTKCCEVSGLGPGVSAKVLKAAPKVKENRRRDGSFEYYISEPVRDNDAKGIGPFIWASLEIEKLGFNTSNVMTPIDRQAVVGRNNPVVTEADNLASLSVGNGHFAATVDVTGLQSYPLEYRAGVPLNAMSDWGWHKFENTLHLKPSESEKTFDLGHGHKEVYAVEYKKAEDGRHKEATEYFRSNPHRLNLGTLGLALKDKQGRTLSLQSLRAIRQEQKLWDGEIESTFLADGESVEVTTGVHPAKDALYARIKSKLLRDRRATVTLRFSYPTGKHADDANDWEKPERHQSEIMAQESHSALIRRTLDETTYYVRLQWEGDASLRESGSHHFELAATGDVLTLAAEYLKEASEGNPAAYEYDQYHKTTQRFWSRWWNAGAIVDFSQCTDPRARELERRVVLSQYLTQINCANNLPPQESGLTYNTWFGRPHLEMTLWHLTHFALWNRPETVGQILKWYNETAYPIARNIANRQGFKGVRWMKMTDPWAGEAPSNTGSFLIWQQPHYIYLAEEMYRAKPAAETLNAYSEQVEATAEFMADFVSFDKKSGRYQLLGATAMQESLSKDIAYNQPFELAYWQYGLSVAQRWRERQGKPRVALWDDIITKLSPLPESKGIYTAGIPAGDEAPSAAFDPFDAPSGKTESFLEKCRSDHPAVLGACGMLPSEWTPYTLLYKKEKMKTTLGWVMQNWNWQTTWGWDYGMIAMAAARLGDTETALRALLIDTQKNTYLPNGHNFQTPDRLRIYLPGNGALLSAIAMMCAGWDGCPDPHNPGFPKDGTWNVRWEGLRRMQ